MTESTGRPLRFHRILLKMSGEALMGQGEFGQGRPLGDAGDGRAWFVIYGYSATFQVNQPVGVAQDALQAVFGQKNGQP